MAFSRRSRSGARRASISTRSCATCTRSCATLKHEPDPLATVAARIARKWRLICFDEFHVSDIADAMILGRLLTALFGHGVVFVMTTNYAPDALWPNGLQRERFLPTIALLKQWLDVVEVDAGVDYRLRALEQVETYHVPLDARGRGRAGGGLRGDARRARRGSEAHDRGADARARRRAGSAVWFDFATLCDGPRSQRDYLELARRFSVLFLSGIPRMTARHGRPRAALHVARRHPVRSPREAAGLRRGAARMTLYAEGPNSREFARTVSRLAEMQTHEYMGEAHIAAEPPAG